MADLPTRQELFRRFRNAALAVPGTRISAREIDREGSDLNLIAAAASIMGEEMINRNARAYANNFEDTATGDGLDRVVFDRKGTPRKGASPAVGTVKLTRPTFAAGAGTIDGGPPGSFPTPSRIRTNRGITYILTEPAIFGALDLGPLFFTVEAELAGTAYEVDAGQSWTWVDVPFDASIVIENDDATAGASEEEEDDKYKARAKGFFPTLRRGTIGAIEFGLLSTDGVESASVIETVDENGVLVPVVTSFILDSLGRANQTLAARGQLKLLEFRAAGIPVFILQGEPEFISIRFEGTDFDTSIVLDTSSAADDVRIRIVAALNNQRSGEKLLRSTILAAARSVPGFIVDDVDLKEPAAALIPSSNSKAFRTKKELIAIG